MNEALLQVEAKKEKAKPKQPVTRMNPTIAAMEIMTRKEIKMGEMEQRIARGELPQIPVPAPPATGRQAVQAGEPPACANDATNRWPTHMKNHHYHAIAVHRTRIQAPGQHGVA